MVISMFAEMMKIMEIWHFSRSEPHHTPRKKKENWTSIEKTKETILRICKQVGQVFRGLFLGNKRRHGHHPARERECKILYQFTAVHKKSGGINRFFMQFYRLSRVGGGLVGGFFLLKQKHQEGVTSLRFCCKQWLCSHLFRIYRN